MIDEAVSLRQEVVQLTEQVQTDNLTGLYNYRYFKLTLEQEMERTHRTTQSTALIMLDLDHFKKVNDVWGHQAGNEALITTAKVLRSMTRKLDIVCRYGGEEFGIILHSNDLMTCMQIAERVRAEIEATAVSISNNQKIDLTASLGIAVYTSLHDDSSEQWVQRADQCMYMAKTQGRNQVCHDGLPDDQRTAAVSQDERDALSGFYAGQENREK